MENDPFLSCFKTLDEFEEDEGHLLPWRREMLYEIEPELRKIAGRAVSQKRRRFPARREAYCIAKSDALQLVGWYARDPRLRSREAWDCYFDYILSELKLQKEAHMKNPKIRPNLTGPLLLLGLLASCCAEGGMKGTSPLAGAALAILAAALLLGALWMQEGGRT